MTALGMPPIPCHAAPDRWFDDHTRQDTLRACRGCWNRWSCAAEAVRDADTIWRLQGVVAGVAIPPQNSHGTSKSRRHALQRLQGLAELGRTMPPPIPTTPDVTTAPGPVLRLVPAPPPGPPSAALIDRQAS